MSTVRLDGCRLYYEEAGVGVPILLVPPAGSTASTWGAAADELARIGRVIFYDRRGYARSGGEPPRTMSAHTTDAAALLERVGAWPTVVVGTSAGAAIAVDLSRCAAPTSSEPSSRTSSPGASRAIFRTLLRSARCSRSDR